MINATHPTIAPTSLDTPACGDLQWTVPGRTAGFWLGGIVLGVGGCILGGCMPYSHPVGVTVSVLWWGLFFGCFGASIGAALGLWAELILDPLPKASQMPTDEEADIWALPGAAGLVAGMSTPGGDRVAA